MALAFMLMQLWNTQSRARKVKPWVSGPEPQGSRNWGGSGEGTLGGMPGTHTGRGDCGAGPETERVWKHSSEGTGTVPSVHLLKPTDQD